MKKFWHIVLEAERPALKGLHLVDAFVLYGNMVEIVTWWYDIQERVGARKQKGQSSFLRKTTPMATNHPPRSCISPFVRMSTLWAVHFWFSHLQTYHIHDTDLDHFTDGTAVRFLYSGIPLFLFGINTFLSCRCPFPHVCNDSLHSFSVSLYICKWIFLRARINWVQNQFCFCCLSFKM